MKASNKQKKKRKVAIIAGSRGEYGYYRPIIREIEKRPDLDYGIIATNMHVLESFGSSITEIEKDRFKIAAVVHNTLDGYNRITMAKSLSIFMLQLPEILKNMGADMVLIAGDRGEQLMAAVVGAHLYLPVAHIQAGERSGNIDGVTRHAIAKFAHIHFAANRDAARRLSKMGEEKFRIFEVGASQLDELMGGDATLEKDLRKQFGLTLGKRLFLVVQHPVTEEFEHAERQMRETLKAVSSFEDTDIILVQNNSDAGSSFMRHAISELRTPAMRIVPNMPREHYAGLLRLADVLVGNSSSGLIEAPVFGLPAVNIGRRQADRLRGKNVIDCKVYEAEAIKKAIIKALSPAFKRQCQKCTNPYGDGQSSKRIVEVLASMPIDEKLLVKRLTY